MVLPPPCDQARDDENDNDQYVNSKVGVIDLLKVFRLVGTLRIAFFYADQLVEA